MNAQWEIQRPDEGLVHSIKTALNCTSITATVLANRQIESAEEAMSVWHPGLDQLRSPFSMKGIAEAVDRLHHAITKKERILIFGDYDVDGITGTVISYEFLRNLGADVSFYIPHRVLEGYGLRSSHITEVACPKKVNLIFTVDCGSSGHEAVAAANNAGIDVIITDHHNISNHPPEAVAVVNPKQSDCTSGLKELAGVGVAFCILICLRKKLRDAGFWKQGKEPNLKRYADLVALGTIADMVPLKKDNRILTKTGIDVINEALRPGLRALIGSCGITPGNLTAEDIAFKIAPRLNAAGRVNHASEAVKLLLASDRYTAENQARRLNEFNAERQEIEKKIVDRILSDIRDEGDEYSTNTIVRAEPGWHEGVLGIVASKVMNRYYKPVILLSIRDGIAIGSARSIPGVDIYQALSNCSSHLLSFGGHESAAGLKLSIDSLEEFKAAFETAVDNMCAEEDIVQKIIIDYELFFADISPNLITELETLQPFGTGNPAPLFMTADVDVLSSKIVGDHHRTMFLSQKGDHRIRIPAIAFNVDPLTECPAHFARIAYYLQWNRWNGRKNTQLVIKAFGAPG
ncbi:MAG: single-stranded-DNA-specific exonuclease RecJ [Desulfobacteraceae bacterium]|nr:single-stranded-DNA-specific exonuclease RecJ [Desulfobacteraceae bacterium]